MDNNFKQGFDKTALDPRMLRKLYSGKLGGIARKNILKTIENPRLKAEFEEAMSGNSREIIEDILSRVPNAHFNEMGFRRELAPSISELTTLIGGARKEALRKANILGNFEHAISVVDDPVLLERMKQRRDNYLEQYMPGFTLDFSPGAA